MGFILVSLMLAVWVGCVCRYVAQHPNPEAPARTPGRLARFAHNAYRPY